MIKYSHEFKSYVSAGLAVLFITFFSAIFLSCTVAFNETMAELYPQFQALGIIPEQVGVAEAQNTGGQLLDDGFDFGWQTQTVFLDIVLENHGTREVSFDEASISGIDATAFSLQGLILPVLIPGNGTVGLNIGFTPVTDKQSTAVLTLSNVNGRLLHIQLSGSGFAQPRDATAWDTLALWLRADRLRKSDLSDTIGTLQQPGVVSWLSLDPQSRLAVAPAGSETLPMYVPVSSNGLPALRFGGDEMLAIELPDSQNIASGDSGTTTFIVFKTASVRFDQRLLTAAFSDASQPSFPTLSMNKWYFDNIDGMYGNGTTNGDPRAQFKFDLWGYGWSLSEPRSPADSMTQAVTENRVYSAVLRYDASIALPASNVTLWLSGATVPLSYLHSYNGNKLSSQDLNGAYGLPVSDENGNKNEELNNPDRYPYYFTSKYDSINSIFKNSLSPTPNNRINDLYIGRKPTGEYYEWDGFNGDVYEILVFSSALNESDIDLINTYLALRYAIE